MGLWSPGACTTFTAVRQYIKTTSGTNCSIWRRISTLGVSKNADGFQSNLFVLHKRLHTSVPQNPLPPQIFLKCLVGNFIKMDTLMSIISRNWMIVNSTFRDYPFFELSWLVLTIRDVYAADQSDFPSGVLLRRRILAQSRSVFCYIRAIWVVFHEATFIRFFKVRWFCASRKRLCFIQKYPWKLFLLF